jgi:cation:H+ antiporter
MAALEASHEASPGLARVALQLGGGMILLGACAHLLVGAVVAGAPRLGVSEWVIGVTVVAAGTSIPEFATALTGLAKGRYGISAGSVIGSDIFNLLGVLGLAGMLHPVEVDVLARASLGSLCAMVLVVLVFIRSGWRISRLEGLVLFLAGLTRWILDFAMHSGRI